MHKEFTTLPDFIKVIKVCNRHVEYQIVCPKCHTRYILSLTHSQHDGYIKYSNHFKMRTYNPSLPVLPLRHFIPKLDFESEYRLLTGICSKCHEEKERVL